MAEFDFEEIASPTRLPVSDRYDYTGPQGARTDPFASLEFETLASAILGAPAFQGRPDLAFAAYKKEASNLAKGLARDATGVATERALAKDERLGIQAERGEISANAGQRAIDLQLQLNKEAEDQAIQDAWLQAFSVGGSLLVQGLNSRKPKPENIELPDELRVGEGYLEDRKQEKFDKLFNPKTDTPFGEALDTVDAVGGSINQHLATRPGAPSQSTLEETVDFPTSPVSEVLAPKPDEVKETSWVIDETTGKWREADLQTTGELFVERPTQEIDPETNLPLTAKIPAAMAEDYDNLIERGKQAGLDLRATGPRSVARTADDTESMIKEGFEAEHKGRHTAEGGFTAIDIPVQNSKESEAYKFMEKYGKLFGFFPAGGKHDHHFIYNPKKKTEEGDGGEILTQAAFDPDHPASVFRDAIDARPTFGGPQPKPQDDYNPVNEYETQIRRYTNDLRGAPAAATLSSNKGKF